MKTKGYVIILLIVIVFAAAYIFQKTTDITLKQILSREEVTEEVTLEEIGSVENIAGELVEEEDIIVPEPTSLEDIDEISVESRTDIFEVEFVEQFVKITEWEKGRLNKIKHIYFVKTAAIAAVTVSACEHPEGEGCVTITTTLFGKSYPLSFESMEKAISVTTNIIRHIQQMD